MKGIDWSRLTDRATVRAIIIGICAIGGWAIAPDRLEAILALTTAAGVVLGVWSQAPERKPEGTDKP